MPLDLTPTQLDTLWSNHEQARVAMKRRQKYFDGEQDVTKRASEQYADGYQKSGKVSNWIRYIVSQFVGALTATPFQVSDDDEGDGAQVQDGGGTETGAAIYKDEAERNSLAAETAESVQDAILKGKGPEVHSVRDGEIVMRSSPADNWVFVYDTQDELVGALYEFCVKESEVHEGVFYADDTTFRVWYDDATITHYSRTGGAGDWSLVSREEHFYGMVPVVDWHINRRRVSYIDDAIIGQQDEYNELDSISGDDIRREVDAFLCIKGNDPDWILAHMKELKDSRFIPCDASYITKGTTGGPQSPIVSRLTRTREHIHMMGNVPDVAQIVGATGATSGIALQLKFMPMHRAASEMINYLKRSLKRRVDLINAMRAKMGKTTIENVSYNINFTLPTNVYEEWAAVRSLDGLVSQRKQLELLSSVDDPAQELNRLALERQESSDAGKTPEQLTQEQAGRVDASAATLESKLDEVVDNISAAVVDKILRDGTVERMANRAQPQEAQT